MANNNTDVFKSDSLTVKLKEKGTLRMAGSIIVFTAISLVLCYYHFTLPFLPNFITIEFSVFPEFLAAIAYGPIIAAIVCLLKTAFIYPHISPYLHFRKKGK